METANPRAMIKPILIMLAVVAALLAAVFGWQFIGATIGKKYMAAAAAAPQTVSTIAAATSEWQPFVQSTGTFRAIRGADLSAQSAGIVDQILFDSGSDVSTGKVLLR